VLTQNGAAKLIPAMRQGLASLNAPRPYLDLLRQIESDPTAIRTLTADQFSAWSATRVKEIDVKSDIFKTMLVTLTEAMLLAPAPLSASHP